MKKLFLIITACLVFSSYIAKSSLAETSQAVQLKISKGTFLKVLSLREICSASADVGDEVSFMNLLDMYVDETNVIPEKSMVYGYVEDVREPVQGTNGAIKIKINKVITPEKKAIPINAYIFSANDNYVGGDQTDPKYYIPMPHYTKDLGYGSADGVLQYAPTNIREDGKPVIIKPGSELFLIFKDDLKIY